MEERLQDRRRRYSERGGAEILVNNGRGLRHDNFVRLEWVRNDVAGRYELIEPRLLVRSENRWLRNDYRVFGDRRKRRELRLDYLLQRVDFIDDLREVVLITWSLGC